MGGRRRLYRVNSERRQSRLSQFLVRPTEGKTIFRNGDGEALFAVKILRNDGDHSSLVTVHRMKAVYGRATSACRRTVRVFATCEQAEKALRQYTERKLKEGFIAQEY